MLDLGQYQVKRPTAREIAATTEAAIRDGRLQTGEALPTIRALARTLKTSPATINSAYRILRERGLVIADGRRGTRVAPRPALRTAVRAPDRQRQHGRDLTIGLPDPALLPPIALALQRVDLERKLRFDALDAPDPGLIQIASEAFSSDGLDARALTVVAGAFDGLERVLQAHLRPGDRVLVEDPAYIGVLDLLLALGLTPVPVPIDDAGLLPEPFEARLERRPAAMIVVPRAQNPLGAAMGPEREAALRTALERHPDVLVIEDDHAGGVAGARFSSLVAPGRPRWAVIRSVSKLLHPDLRLALMAGDPTTIARVEGRQALGPRWVSHVLQALVAELLRDPDVARIIERARDAYTSRREALVEALAAHDLVAHGRSGLNVWVPVREEAPIVRALEQAGWRVLAGERFRLTSSPAVRITTSILPEPAAVELAEVIAGVELAIRPRRLY